MSVYSTGIYIIYNAIIVCFAQVKVTALNYLLLSKLLKINGRSSQEGWDCLKRVFKG